MILYSIIPLALGVGLPSEPMEKNLSGFGCSLFDVSIEAPIIGVRVSLNNDPWEIDSDEETPLNHGRERDAHQGTAGTERFKRVAAQKNDEPDMDDEEAPLNRDRDRNYQSADRAEGTASKSRSSSEKIKKTASEAVERFKRVFENWRSQKKVS